MSLLLILCFWNTILYADSLKLIKKIPHSGYSEGLDFYDGYLWHPSTTQEKTKDGTIAKIDPSDGNVVARYDAAFGHTESVTWFQGGIWNFSFEDNRIFFGKLNSKKNQFDFKKVGETPESHAWGITHNGKELILTGQYYSAKLYFFDPKTVKLKRTVNTEIQSLEDLAWDGKWVWSSSFTSHRGEIFPIDPKTGKVPVFFKLADPDECPIVDGIAIQGKTVWVTGKHCPSIYQFELPKVEVQPSKQTASAEPAR